MNRWVTVIRALIAQSFTGVYTQLPAVVRDYDAKEKTCSLDAAILLDPELPTLLDVPVLVLGTSRQWLHFDLRAGDTGIVHFSMCDLSSWHTSGKPSKPNLLAKFGLYGMFVPGLRHARDSLDLSGIEGAVLGSSGTCVVVREKVSVLTVPDSEGGSGVCKATTFEVWAAAIESAIDALAPGASTTLAQARQGIATTKFEAE